MDITPERIKDLMAELIEGYWQAYPDRAVEPDYTLKEQQVEIITQLALKQLGA